jgi:hypothetical protein
MTESDPHPQTEQPDDESDSIAAIRKTLRAIEKRLNEIMVPAQEFLGRPAACVLLGIDDSTLRKIERGDFGQPPTAIYVGKAKKFHRETLIAWAKARTTPPGIAA